MKLKNGINKLDKEKAIAIDDIHNAMLKHFSKLFIDVVITSFFNLCLQFNIFPTLSGKCNIIPIPKPDKDHRFASNYRPIALLENRLQ